MATFNAFLDLEFPNLKNGRSTITFRTNQVLLNLTEVGLNYKIRPRRVSPPGDGFSVRTMM
jgi:hypothetical protein